MDRFINFTLMRHPMNWIIVGTIFLMALTAANIILDKREEETAS